MVLDENFAMPLFWNNLSQVVGEQLRIFQVQIFLNICAVVLHLQQQIKSKRERAPAGPKDLSVHAIEPLPLLVAEG